MTTYIGETLLESKCFQRTEDAVSSKTWIREDACNGTWLGFSRIPSANMLVKRGALEKCPHDYMLKSDPSTLKILLVAPASKLEWTLKFNDASEQLKWLAGHVRKTMSKHSLPEVKRHHDAKRKQMKCKTVISSTLALRSH